MPRARIALSTAAVVILCFVALLASPPAAAQQGPSFTLINHGRAPIRALYWTPSGDANWGLNRLTGAPIAVGARYEARRRPDGNCIFDVRVVYVTGGAEERRNLNICTVHTVAFGDAAGKDIMPAAGAKAPDDPSFRLINNLPQSIMEVFATQAGNGTWGQNRLSTPLPPQSNRIVHIAQQGVCRFDLRIVLADHSAKERHGTDLCRVTDLPVP